MWVYIGISVVLMFTNRGESFSLWDESHTRPCPQLDPISHLDVSQLSGKWYASLTIVDTVGGGADYEESDVCLTGEIVMVNSTGDTSNGSAADLHQVWTLHSPSSSDPSAVIHVTSRQMRPGVWLLHTPLDGKVKATIYGYEKGKYMAVCGCGWRGGRQVHLWTSAITRDGSLTSLARQVVGRVLEEGSDQATKLISWNTRCLPTPKPAPQPPIST